MGVFVGVTGERSCGKATIPLFYYRGGGIRTPDLSVPNRALYQAEPRPDKMAIIHAKRLSSNRFNFRIYFGARALAMILSAALATLGGASFV
jgi:hypothetical protein